MSRLGDILNGIMNPFGKELWSGTWSSGTITVPDSDKYFAFVIYIGNNAAICMREGTSALRGYTITATSATGTQYVKIFYATTSGNTWTWGFAKQLTHTESSNHGASATQSITKIVGLIPNWGE